MNIFRTRLARDFSNREFFVGTLLSDELINSVSKSTLARWGRCGWIRDASENRNWADPVLTLEGVRALSSQP